MRVIIALLAFASGAYAHEMTPTYFDIKPSFVDGVSVVEMSFWKILTVGLFPFLIGDMVKILAAMGLFPYVWKKSEKLA